MKHRPIISLAIRPRIEGDWGILQQALSDIAELDRAIRVETGAEDGYFVISGSDELQLQRTCDRVLHQHNIQLEAGEPTVIYLETIRAHAAAEGKYIRQTGGSGNYAHVKICIEPNGAGKGFEFINEIKGGVIPQEYIMPVEMGVREAMQGGVLAGHELVDVKVSLFDGSFHEVDSNQMAFQIAASMAFKEAARKANPVVLEPVMAVKVTVPEEFTSVIIGDLNSRRGRIEGITNHRGSASIRAMVPLSRILRSSMQRWRIYSVRFARYEQAPRRQAPGEDEASVTANKPNRPKAGSGFVALNLDAQT